MIMFCVFCVVRLLSVVDIFLLFGVVILINVKCCFFVVCLVKCYLFWNYGLFGCLMRKLIFMLVVLVVWVGVLFSSVMFMVVSMSVF